MRRPFVGATFLDTDGSTFVLSFSCPECGREHNQMGVAVRSSLCVPCDGCGGGSCFELAVGSFPLDPPLYVTEAEYLEAADIAGGYPSAGEEERSHDPSR